MGDHQTYTIQELAELAGMTARNIRAYSTRQLLPGPLRQGRAARYDQKHLERLSQIRDLREAGLPLTIIEEAARRGADLGPQGNLARLAAGSSGIDIRGIPARASAESIAKVLLGPQVVVRLGEDPELVNELIEHGVLSGEGNQLSASAEVSDALTCLLNYDVAPASALRVALHAAHTTHTLSAVVTEVLQDAGGTIVRAAHGAMVQLSIGVVRDTFAKDILDLFA